MTTVIQHARGQGDREANRLLGVLYHVTLSAIRAGDLRSLRFHILNETIKVCPYDRAALWDVDRRGPVLLGVSGQDRVDPRAPAVAAWRRIVKRLPRELTQVQADTLPGREADWATVMDLTAESAPEAAANDTMACALWLPLRIRGRARVGLWLERRRGPAWTLAERTLVASLGEAYEGAWEKFHVGGGALRRWSVGLLRLLLIGVLLVGAAYGLTRRTEMRLVAPCEVVPYEPVVVAAPLGGVVETVHVERGAQVRRGDLLVSYDRRVPLKELEVARKQVAYYRSQIRQLEADAFDDRRAANELAQARHRLAAEGARLALAEREAARLRVLAPTDGRVLVEDPQAWRGRRVEVGERILRIVPPAATRARAWLPEADRAEVSLGAAVRIYLDDGAGAGIPATVAFIAPRAGPSPEGVPAFVVEGAWNGAAGHETARASLGVRGTAVVLGREVSVGYMLLRKPWIELRRWFAF